MILLGDCTSWSWRPTAHAGEFPVLQRALVTVFLHLNAEYWKTRFCENFAFSGFCRVLRSCVARRTGNWSGRAMGSGTLLQTVFFGSFVAIPVAFAAKTTVSPRGMELSDKTSKIQHDLYKPTEWRSGAGVWLGLLSPWKRDPDRENRKLRNLEIFISKLGMDHKLGCLVFQRNRCE